MSILEKTYICLFEMGVLEKNYFESYRNLEKNLLSLLEGSFREKNPSRSSRGVLK